MLAILLINLVVVALVVVIHYEFLLRLVSLLPGTWFRHRARIVIGVFWILLAHVIEIWVFALAYFVMHRAEGWGTLFGNFDGSLLACAYFSFTTFSTLGFGDIEPSGAIRYLTGIESLTGLVLITWSASFLFIEMQKHWNSR
jgi:hypothetical protein